MLVLETINSFVRSITMDKWSDEHINKMIVGGNAKAKDYFGAQFGFDKKSIKEKYNSDAAKLYREKLQLEANKLGPKILQGTDSTINSSKFSNQPSSIPSSSTSLQYQETKLKNSSSSINLPKSNSPISIYTSPANVAKSNSNSNVDNIPSSLSKSSHSVSSYTGDSNSYRRENSYHTTGGENNSQEKVVVEKRNQFFLDKQKENANKPNSLPPSQGGKYEGFGNQLGK